MEAITRYCTTDLDLYSAENLTALAAAFEARGFMLMRPVTRYSDGEWFCGFSRGGGGYDEPEPHLAAILTVIEGLDPTSRSAWAGCSRGRSWSGGASWRSGPCSAPRPRTPSD